MSSPPGEGRPRPRLSSSPSMDEGIVLKIVLVGDSGVGKSNLLAIRHIGNSRKDSNPNSPTAGVEFVTRTCQVELRNVKAQIWDTSGKETFKQVTTALYRGAAGIMLVYDVGKQASFENCNTWLRELHDHADPDVVIMLVGNKCDMEHRRVVPTEKGRLFAERNGLLFIETSTFEVSIVDTAFCTLITEIIRRRNKMLPPPQSPLHREDSSATNKFQLSWDQLAEKTAQLQATTQRLERELREARLQESIHRQKLEDEINRRLQMEQAGHSSNGSLSPIKEHFAMLSMGKEIASRADYTVLRHLGGGNFDRVCLAVRKSDHAKFAIKEVNWSGIAAVNNKYTSEQLINMAAREAEQMVILQHPNILRVFGFFEENVGGSLYHHLIMEHFESGELHDLLIQRRGQLFPPAQIYPWIEQLCSAVKYLHDREILHRDIKTTNIFCLDGNRILKLGDFGLSKDVKQCVLNNAQMSSNFSTDNSFNPIRASKALVILERYVAPELLSTDNAAYTDKCDVWSLGVAIYEIACLQLPFDSPTGNRAEIKTKVLTEKAKDTPPIYGSSLQQLVESLLDKDPVKRLNMPRALRFAVLLSTMDAAD